MRHDVEFETARAEEKRAEAARWKAEFGGQAGLGAARYAKIKGAAGLEGMLREAKHRLGGEISSGPNTIGSPQIAACKQQIIELQAEINWRRANPDRDPITRTARPEDNTSENVALVATWTKRTSPGAPTKASQRVTLPNFTWNKKAA
jgi:hypothetical protein